MGSITGGLRAAGDLKVTAPVSGMTVNVATGECIIPGSSSVTQGGYYGLVSSTTSLVVAASNATNPRVDLVAGVVTDAGYTGATNTFVLATVTGTPTPGATLGNLSGAPGLPTSALLLAYVLVPATSTSVINGNIANIPAVAPSIIVISGLIQPGDLKWSAVAGPLSGYLLCDGTLYTGGASTYAALAAACPGLVSGGNLTVPDFRGRAPVGPDPTGVHMTAEHPALLASGGADTHLLTSTESGQKAGSTSSGTTGTGTTGLPYGSSGFVAGGLSSAGITVGGSSYGLVSFGLTIPSLSVPALSIAGSSAAAAHTNVQPYLAMNAFIKT